MQSITEYERVIRSITECQRVLQSITEYYRVLQTISECYRVLQSITEYYRVLQGITEHCTVLQSIKKTYLAHLLGPIFGLVFILGNHEKICSSDSSKHMRNILSLEIAKFSISWQSLE